MSNYPCKFGHEGGKYSNGVCKECKSKSAASYALNNRAKIQSRRRKYYVDHWHYKLILGARHRKIKGVVSITPEWILEQFKKQNGRCFYSGRLLVPTSKLRDLNKPSLDRVDNSNRDYTPENTRLVCWGWNIARGDSSVEETLKFWGLDVIQ